MEGNDSPLDASCHDARVDQIGSLLRSVSAGVHTEAHREGADRDDLGRQAVKGRRFPLGDALVAGRGTARWRLG